MKINAGQAPSTLVPKYIGSDYDKVKSVADNIKTVIEVVDNLDHINTVENNLGSINTITDNITDVVTVSDNIDYVKDVAEGIEGLPVTSYIGDEPPTQPLNGAEWYCTTDGRSYVWYADADSSQWVESSPQSTIETDPSAVFTNTANIFALWKRSAAEAGYNLVAGSFEEGGVLTSSTDVLWHKELNSIYSWAGVYPINGYVVSPNTNPVGNANYVPRTDVTLRETLPVNVAYYLAVGTGDETSKIQAAVNATPPGGILVFEPNKTYNVSELNVDGKSIVLKGYGATINCTGTTGAIHKTDHDNKLSVIGLNFTGSGCGIYQNATIQGSSRDELDIIGCSFDMNTGAYGIKVVGGRNPRIQNCFFKNSNLGSGVYFKDTVSPFLSTCTFKGGGYVGRAVYYPGTGNGTDAGLIIRACEIMGWDKGVVIEGCTIDYNNQSIKLGSQDGANISNNYIGSLGNTPALWITYDAAGTAPTYSEKIFVVNNTFTGHYTADNTYDCILVNCENSPDNIVISNNSISFYTRYGINFSLLNTKMLVDGNSFAQRTGFGVAPVFNSLGNTDSAVKIINNMFNDPTTISAINVSSVCPVNSNIGCVTENRGEAVVGSGISTFNISHGLAYTPSKSDISLTPTNAEAAAKNPYVNSVDATNINVGFTLQTTSNAGVGWRVRRYA